MAQTALLSECISALKRDGETMTASWFLSKSLLHARACAHVCVCVCACACMYVSKRERESKGGGEGRSRKRGRETQRHGEGERNKDGLAWGRGCRPRAQDVPGGAVTLARPWRVCARVPSL